MKSTSPFRELEAQEKSLCNSEGPSRPSGPRSPPDMMAYSRPDCRASVRAKSVLPVPGGPWSSMPRTCLMPRSRTTWGGKVRAANARRKMLPNSLERPPMPSSSKSKSGRKMLRCCTLLLSTCSFPDGPCCQSSSVTELSKPAGTLAGAEPVPRSTGMRPRTVSFRTLLSKSMTNVWEFARTCLSNCRLKTASRSSSLISTLGSCAAGFRKKSISSLQDPRSNPGGGVNCLTNTSVPIPILAYSRCTLPSAMSPGATPLCTSRRKMQPLTST
mmetsp:Transcript_52935/g.166264  ORF Transcript_52935/g.166264 Transcript_52935/m.166264 type:complete len:272 (+) Transcript_52935:550-1365(+)